MSYRLMVVVSLAVMSGYGCGFSLIKVVKESESTTTSEKKQSLDSPAKVSAGSPLLNADDLEPTEGFKLKSTSEKSVVDALNNESAFYAYRPDAADKKKSLCTQQINKSKSKADAKNLVITIDEDLKKCSNDDPEKGTGYRVSKSKYKMRFVVTCSKGDLSSLNGQGIDDFEPLAFERICQAGTILVESVSDVEMEMEKGESVKIRYLNLFGTKDLKGCKFTANENTLTRADGCFSFKKQDSTETSKDLVDNKVYKLSKYTYRGIQSEIGSGKSLWHAAGAVDVLHDDWSGTLTYVGPDTAPSYDLVQDKTNKKLKGTLKASASLLLAD